jgi:hypothetical protein
LRRVRFYDDRSAQQEIAAGTDPRVFEPGHDYSDDPGVWSWLKRYPDHRLDESAIFLRRSYWWRKDLVDRAGFCRGEVMNTNKIIAAVLLAATVSGAHATPSQDALAAIAAFTCVHLAEDAADVERLFKIGYASGNAFLNAARAGKITAEDSKKVPWFWNTVAGGPSNDFILGRLYHALWEHVYNDIHRGVDGVLTDEQKKLARANKYVQGNCALLK